MTEPIDELELCPKCLGRPAAPFVCDTCEGAGVLDGAGAPFHAPPPFDGWLPLQLVTLARVSRLRKEAERTMNAEPTPTPAPAERPARLSTTEVARALLSARTAGATKTSSAEITQGQRGGVGWTLGQAVGEPGIETLEDAVTVIIAQHERLRELAAKWEGEPE